MRCFLSRIDGTITRSSCSSGRCYENESVPYKALDGVVDSLSVAISRRFPPDVESLLPPDVGGADAGLPGAAAGARHRTPAAGAGARESPSRSSCGGGRSTRCASCSADRRRATRWSSAIDDLQWADADSAVLLEELLRPPGAPAMLTLLSFRSEETAGKPFLRALLERAGRGIWSAMSRSSR